MHRSTAVATLVVVSLSCNSGGFDDNPFDSVSGGGIATTLGAEGSGPGSGGAATVADADSGGLKLDVSAPGTSMADDGGDEDGCDKVDFLFIVDNSGSMADEQDNLIANFGTFITTIQQTLTAQDYHVMVVDTDAAGGGSSSINCTNGVCTCEPVPACCDTVCQMASSCNGFSCADLPGGDCDGTLGAGKVFRADGTECLDPEGPRYMTSEAGDLDQQFSCAAEVGTFGDGNEQPMAAMLNAITEPLVDDMGCNSGFLRDDAILVVTFITDEEDADKSPGSPATWHDGLVAAKGGNEDAIVVLGLFGDTDQPGAVCTGGLDGNEGAEPAPRLRSFVESFGDRGITGSVCADDYSSFFMNAVSFIDITCDEYIPEG